MRWVKDALIDIVVTVVIVLATFGGIEWARWAVAIYTPIMLLIWIGAYSRRFAQSKLKAAKTTVPEPVFHVLYGANLLLTAYDRWWWVAACWALIWFLSAATSKASSSRPTEPSK